MIDYQTVHRDFLKWGVAPVIIHFTGIFQYKPSIWGYHHLWKPHIIHIIINNIESNSHIMGDYH